MPSVQENAVAQLEAQAAQKSFASKFFAVVTAAVVIGAVVAFSPWVLTTPLAIADIGGKLTAGAMAIAGLYSAVKSMQLSGEAKNDMRMAELGRGAVMAERARELQRGADTLTVTATQGQGRSNFREMVEASREQSAEASAAR